MIRILLGLVLILAASPAHAQEPPSRGRFLVSLNYMWTIYPQPLKERKESAGRLLSVSHLPFHADVIGYYPPRAGRIWTGGVLQVGFERYGHYGRWLLIDSYQPSFSAIVFLDDPKGASMFLRGDDGPALLRVSSDDAGTEYTRFGFGLLAATGVSFELRSRLVLISFNFAYKNLRRQSYLFYSMGLGGLL